MGLTVGGGKPYIIPLPHMGPSKQTTILDELSLSYIWDILFHHFILFHPLLSSLIHIFFVVIDVKMPANDMVGA